MINKVKNKIDELYSSNVGRWLLAIGICFICIGIVILTRPVFFYLHDTNMMKTYSGYRTGIPTPEHTYGNMFIGYLMYGLYSISRSIPWYTILALGILFFCVVAICKCLLSVAYNKNITIVYPVLLFLTLYVIAFYYQMGVVLYTVNAAIVGCAAIAFLFSAFTSDSKKIFYIDIFLSFILLFIASIIRYSSYKACLSFWSLVLVINLFLHYKQKANIKKILFILVTSILVVLAIKAGNLFGDELRKENFPEGFYELNKYRAKFMDYNTIEYSEDPEFYQSIGWSESFYTMVKNDYFMDPKYNVESLKKIYDYSVQKKTVKNTLEELWELGCDIGVLTNVGLSLTCGMIFAFVLLLSVFMIRFKKKNILSFLCGVFAFGGCFLMCLYLCWQGRFPLRVYQVTAFPTLTTMLFSVLMIMEREKKKENSFLESLKKMLKQFDFRSISLIFLMILMSTFWGIASIKSLSASYDEEEIARYQNDNERYSAMVHYAQDNPENIYIHDITISGDERLVINSEKENALNLILWGGTNLYTSSYIRQLSMLGRSQLQTENLFDDNVYYMTGMGDTYMNYLLNYLIEEYGSVSFEQVDYLEEGVRVYKIQKNNLAVSGN